MERLELTAEIQLAQLREHLQAQRYSCVVTTNYVVNARAFLHALGRKGIDARVVLLTDVDRYLAGLTRRRGQCKLPAMWLRSHRAAVQMLLRLVQGQWPPKTMP
ncbi:hypothetical protein H0A71_20195 [Alcaligenaceae bacterium]|nr:hypothetical protein [Alcaligenaceae bacterium]